MSKAQRIRETNARQRIAAQQAAARKAETRRRLVLASGSVLLVIAIVVGLIIAKNVGSGSANVPSATAAEVSQVSGQITSVPASTLNAVGAGSGVSHLLPTQGNPIIDRPAPVRSRRARNRPSRRRHPRRPGDPPG